MTILSSVGHRLRVQQTVAGRLAFEGTLVVAGVLALGLSAGFVSAGLAIDGSQARDVLAMLTAGLGAVAVMLGHTAGRLSGNRRAEWLVPALGLYCALIVPGTALQPDRAVEVANPRLGTLVSYLMVAVLLVAAIRPPARSGQWGGWAWAAGTAVAVMVLNVTEAALPGIAWAIPRAINLVVLCFLCAVSTAVVVAGYRTSRAPLWRIGLGFGVIAAAHLYRVAFPHQSGGPGLVFASLRLAGIVVVLLGMAKLLRWALNAVLSEQFQHQEELRLANLHAEQIVRAAAERDHELRNGLTGLSGMTRLLAGADADERRRHERLAVLHELDRLHDMLSINGPHPQAGIYDAAGVVRELVALWKVAGLAIDATMPADLVVVGRPSTLAQVMTNLLTNCSRHAPGAHVQVIGQQVGPVVTVQVRDDGPGTSTGPGPSEGATVEGHGLGLRICRRLLEAEGSRLHLPPSDPGRPGFVAVVELNAVGAGDPPPVLPAQSRNDSSFASRVATSP